MKNQKHLSAIVSSIIILVWGLLACSCGFKGYRTYGDEQGLLKKIEAHSRWEHPTLYYLIYEYNGHELTVQTSYPGKYQIGNYYPITPLK